MVLQIGVSDSSLQKELGAIKNQPCRRSTKSWRVLNRHVKLQPLLLLEAMLLVEVDGSQICQGMPNPGRGRGERCLALRGKCFRCARDDHLLPQCSYSERVKCNSCAAIGHISAACDRSQNVRSKLQSLSAFFPSTSSAQQPQQLAIAYDGGPASQFSADGASSAWANVSSSSRAGGFYAPLNRPTPEMPL